MNDEKTATDPDPNSILESLTKTLLYEGYSLYPYYRSAVKNQKPIPFGVIFPKDYNAFNEYSHSGMQSQCIICGGDDLTVSINVRFLHLRKIDLFEHNNNNDDFVSTYSLAINGNIYQAGWQTIERKINTGDLFIPGLIENSKTIPIEFDRADEGEIIFNEVQEVVAKKIISVSAINGEIKIEAGKIQERDDIFRLTVTVINTTPLENADAIIRDEALLQSILSTHIVLQTIHGEFISHQDPPEKWRDVISDCNNINTWPILIDKSNTTLLSSPIILYDYPEINSLSSGDLFDSIEIEEALLFHVNLLSDDDKKRIGENDEKLQAMLNRVSSLTPEDLNKFHGVMKDSSPGELTNALKK